MSNANEVQLISSQDFGDIRVITISGESWFVGNDIATALGYEKARNALTAHVDEDDALKWGVADSLGRKQETTIVNESGLYSLILSSKLPTAKKFKHWVTKEVLPTIRKHGAYSSSQKMEQGMPPTKQKPQYVHIPDNIEAQKVIKRINDNLMALSAILDLTNRRCELGEFIGRMSVLQHIGFAISYDCLGLDKIELELHENPTPQPRQQIADIIKQKGLTI